MTHNRNVTPPPKATAKIDKGIDSCSSDEEPTVVASEGLNPFLDKPASEQIKTRKTDAEIKEVRKIHVAKISAFRGKRQRQQLPELQKLMRKAALEDTAEDQKRGVKMMNRVEKALYGRDEFSKLVSKVNTEVNGLVFDVDDGIKWERASFCHNSVFDQDDRPLKTMCVRGFLGFTFQVELSEGDK